MNKLYTLRQGKLDINMRGIWKHTKTNKKYQFIITALDVNTMKPVVLYSGSSIKVNKTGMWIRPLDEFLGTVKIKGKKVKRFTKD